MGLFLHQCLIFVPFSLRMRRNGGISTSGPKSVVDASLSVTSMVEIWDILQHTWRLFVVFSLTEMLYRPMYARFRHSDTAIRFTDPDFCRTATFWQSRYVFGCFVISGNSPRYFCLRTLLTFNLIPVPLSLTSLLMLLSHLLAVSTYHSHHP